LTGRQLRAIYGEKDRSIQELYAEVVKNETRNQQIADDVYEC